MFSIYSFSKRLSQEPINDSYKNGYAQAIEDLRALNDMFRHRKQWNHSRSSYFAPVELSDWLLINGYRPIQRIIKEQNEKNTITQ